MVVEGEGGYQESTFFLCVLEKDKVCLCKRINFKQNQRSLYKQVLI